MLIFLIHPCMVVRKPGCCQDTPFYPDICHLYRLVVSLVCPQRKRVLALMKPILLAEICLITRLGRTWAQPMLDAVQPQQRGELPADSPFTHHSITNIWQRRSIRHYKLDYQRDRLFEILRSPGCQGADPYRLLCTIPALARWATNLITINTFSANPDSLIKDYVLYGHAYDKVQRHLRSGNYAGTAAGVLRDAGRELGAAAARWRQHAKQYVADPDQPLDPGLIRRLYTHQPAAEVAGLTEAIAGRVAVHHILDLGCNECGFLWAGRSTDAGVIRAIKARVRCLLQYHTASTHYGEAGLHHVVGTSTQANPSESKLCCQTVCLTLKRKGH